MTVKNLLYMISRFQKMGQVSPLAGAWTYLTYIFFMANKFLKIAMRLKRH